MKKLLVATCIGLLLASCTPKEELSEQEAVTLLRQQMNYPKTFTYDIFCADPEYSQKALDAGLETKGLVIIKRTQKLSDVGQSLIEFTNQASPYLVTLSDLDKKTSIQKVKIADEYLNQVSEIMLDEDGKKATIKYTTIYKNTTPFSSLAHIDLQKPITHTVYLILADNGWKLKGK
ncbi:hypothetical protein [Xanthocytophaga agilis]|uniref:Lipoprotein n=1 Tax=Xanthocytophaga agilis TaxID=3048010 RepID=A0AAE3R8T6_9BACT|nr:hypothetical protein [Xanthocytophaga agilis]MDJ1503559.1 hypothetical protein [Xanthocytophaga agilis]